MTKDALEVLVNRDGGAAARAGPGLHDSLAAAFAATGVPVDIRLLASDQIAEAIAAAATRGRRIVVAGGDGTISGAAQALCGTNVELALLPLGTLNHFARDLGIPNDLAAAAALAAHGRADAVDVGMLNGRAFINNASIGLYPLMVRERDAVRSRRGWPKWLATIPAFRDAIGRLPHHRLRIDMKGREKPLVTPLLFVGNNRYSLDRGTVGARSSLQDGQLSIFAVARRSRLGLIWFAARALLGQADRRTDFVMIGDSSEFVVRSGARAIHVALDGEVDRMTAPLRFAIAPRALKVVVPDLDDASRSIGADIPDLAR